jgi:hypothetical protein
VILKSLFEKFGKKKKKKENSATENKLIENA